MFCLLGTILIFRVSRGIRNKQKCNNDGPTSSFEDSLLHYVYLLLFYRKKKKPNYPGLIESRKKLKMMNMYLSA